MEKVKNIAIVIAVFMLAMIGTIHSLERVSSNSTRSDSAVGDTMSRKGLENTAKHAFVSSCSSDGASREQCTCAVNVLLDLYPDFLTNERRIKVILREGYNQKEVDAMLPCFDSSYL